MAEPNLGGGGGGGAQWRPVGYGNWGWGKEIVRPKSIFIMGEAV